MQAYHSVALWLQGLPSWIGDIQYVLQNLPIAIQLHMEHIADPNAVLDLIKLVEKSCAQTLYSDIAQSTKTYLIRSPTEPSSSRLQLQPYLKMLHLTAYRKALTQLITSNHCLAVERLRWKIRRGGDVPRRARLCRFCKTDVEDEKHALFLCKSSPELTNWRAEFFNRLRDSHPDLLHAFMDMEVEDFMRLIIRRSDELPILALSKLAFKVLNHFDSHEIYIAPHEAL